MTETQTTEAPSFEAQLDAVLERAGGDPARASSMEPVETKPVAKPQEPNLKVEQKVEAERLEAKEPEKKEESSEDLLELLSKGEDITEEKLGKPGDRPTDESSREFQKWSELRKAYDTLRKEKETWTKESAELKTKIPSDYEQLKKESEELRVRLAERDLTETPQFKQEIIEPLTALYGDFEKVADALKVNKDLLLGAIEDTNELSRERKIHELFSSLEDPPTPGTIAKLSLKADRIHELMDRQKLLLANAPDVTKALKEREEKAQAERTAKEQAAYEQAANVTLQVIAKTIPALQKDGKVDQEALEEARIAAKTDWNSLKPAQKALALVSPYLLQKQVKAAGEYESKLKAKDEEIAALKLKMGKLSATQPGTATSAAPASTARSNGSDPFENLTSAQLRKMAI